MNNILPCPYCGKDPKIEVHTEVPSPMGFITCRSKTCVANPTVTLLMDKPATTLEAELIVKWNTRI